MNTVLATEDVSKRPHVVASTLRIAIELTGFAFTLLAVLYWIQPHVVVGGLSVVQWWVRTGGLCLAMVLVQLLWQSTRARVPNKKPSIPLPNVRWILGWGVTAIVGAAPFMVDPRGLIAIGVALFVLLFAAIIAWRLHPVPYALVAIGFGTWVGYYCGKATYGAAATLAIGFAMAVSNYLFLLVTEHWQDAKRVAARLRWRHRQPTDISVWQFIKAFYYFWPAAAIVCVGIVLHNAAQDGLESRFYEGQMVLFPQAPDGTPLDSVMPPERDLGLDALYTLSIRKQEDLLRLTRYVDTAYQRLLQETDRTPEKVDGVLKANQPAEISNAPCDKFKVRVLRKNITFRSPCREAIADINGRVRQRYDALESRINQQVNSGVFAVEQQAQASRDRTLAEGREAIEREYDAYALIVHRSMQAAFWAKLIGGVAIVSAIFAGLLATLGRITFDTRTGGIFRLSDDTPRPLKISASPVGEHIPVLDLTELKIGSDGTTRAIWYRSHLVSCGAPQHLKAPQPTRSILQRVLTGRYLLSRIDLDESTTKLGWRMNTALRHETTHPYEFKLAKVTQGKLVAIELQPAQEIVFPMRALVAFSADLTLRSVYSTKVAANCLGLGNFQSIACGPGVLVLASHGTIASIAATGRDPIALLAWDRGLPFTLVQAKLGVLSLILNSPNVAPVDIDGNEQNACAVIDQQVSPPRFWRKIWNLIRYILVPF